MVRRFWWVSCVGIWQNHHALTLLQQHYDINNMVFWKYKVHTIEIVFFLCQGAKNTYTSITKTINQNTFAGKLY